MGHGYNGSETQLALDLPLEHVLRIGRSAHPGLGLCCDIKRRARLECSKPQPRGTRPFPSCPHPRTESGTSGWIEQSLTQASPDSVASRMALGHVEILGEHIQSKWGRSLTQLMTASTESIDTSIGPNTSSCNGESGETLHGALSEQYKDRRVHRNSTPILPLLTALPGDRSCGG